MAPVLIAQGEGNTGTVSETYQARRCMKESEKIEKAVDIGMQWGLIDGADHKMWVIDQMLRALLGKKYKETLKEYKQPDDDDDYWDGGIAP